MKKSVFRLITILLVISFICALITALSSCNKEKKAILLLHGIMGGVFYDTEENIAIWNINSLDPVEAVQDGLHINRNLYKLALDENGDSQYDNIRLANMNDEVGRYSILDLFEPMYNELKKKYGKKYDIIVWQYDWRQSPETIAVSLEDFISEKGYDKVIFTVHSMGGVVVSEYLSRSEANRAKTELFISICTPYFGAMSAYQFPFDGILADVMPPLGNLTREFGINLPSVYMLSPAPQFQYSPDYLEGDPMVILNGQALTYEGIEAFYKERDFAIKGDGSLKYAFVHKEAFNARHMVELNGETVHISRLVNTHYIQGIGYNTMKTLDITYDSKKKKYVLSRAATTDGDGTVSIYSGTAGMPLDASNVYLIAGPDHITMLAYDETVATVMSIFAEFFS